ncbi:LptF/LptG family permease [Nonlabens tegetincola]|uniref:LptF/LptG family permease n=1 Tax=Nonlabens tegetincola TaxID=323273 RepID=UPI0030C8A27C
MKILDRYILTKFTKTFLSVFIVFTFILVLQAIWLYIKALAGKDLDAETIFLFLYYNIPLTIPLSLPLSVLLAALLVFGEMAENYEFAAMKSNGISLQRAMRSLTIIILSIGITSFFFANTVIPWGNLKQKNLINNIKRMKPAMAIVEGSFEQLGDYNIKVTKKSGDNGRFLEDVIIHKKTPNRTGNFTVIKSKKGELKSSLKSDVIQLVLYDGNYYEEMIPKTAEQRISLPFIKGEFKEYELNVDVSELNEVDLDTETVTDNQKMLRINELKERIDTFVNTFEQNMKVYHQTQHTKWTPENIDNRVKEIDSIVYKENFFDTMSIFDQRRAIENAINRSKSDRSAIQSRISFEKTENERLWKHEIEIHKKYVLGIACIILFFIGAPLGAIIRKGGLGLPLVVAVVFFLTYHFINIGAEQSATRGAIPVWLGAWLGTMIIFPIGVILTYRATSDQGFFDVGGAMDSLFRIFKKKPNKA